RKVFNEKEDNEDEANNLPKVCEGENLPIIQSEVLEKQTKPKPLHTESSLLSAMEMPCQREQSQTCLDMPSAAGIRQRQSAGKEVENEEEREAMRESGIGTPATRAAIIETLFARDYIVREKKSLVPTSKGLSVYEIVKDKRIADVSMTGQWENALARIESGEMQPQTFHRTIEVYTRQITTELLETSVSHAGENNCVCPKCKVSPIRF
ncbi:DNA topoisomerase 3, partial [termite gut metagenome]